MHETISLYCELFDISTQLDFGMMRLIELIQIKEVVKQYGSTESLIALYGNNFEVSVEGISTVISKVIEWCKTKLKELGELFIKAYKWIKEKIFGIKQQTQSAKLEKYPVHYDPKEVIDFTKKIYAQFNLITNDLQFTEINYLEKCEESINRTKQRLTELQTDPPVKSKDDIEISKEQHTKVCHELKDTIDELEKWFTKYGPERVRDLTQTISNIERHPNPLTSEDFNAKQIAYCKEFVILISQTSSKAIKYTNKLIAIHTDYNNEDELKIPASGPFLSKYVTSAPLIRAIENGDKIAIRASIITIMDGDMQNRYNTPQPIADKVAMDVDTYLKQHNILNGPLFDQENHRLSVNMNDLSKDTLHRIRAAMQINFSIEKIKKHSECIIKLRKEGEL